MRQLPCYDCYEPGIAPSDGTAVHLKVHDGTFAVDWAPVKAAVTHRTRMLIVNSPHKPCGSVLSAAELATLAELTRDTETIVLADEVYEHIVFDGHLHQRRSGYPLSAFLPVTAAAAGPDSVLISPNTCQHCSRLLEVGQAAGMKKNSKKSATTTVKHTRAVLTYTRPRKGSH